MKTKLVALIAVVTFILTGCKQPDGKLSGVITYYFNENYGDKPDVGAKIYIISIDSAKVAKINAFEIEKGAARSMESTERLMISEKQLMETYRIPLTASYYSKAEKDDYKKKIEEIQVQLNKEESQFDSTYLSKYETASDSAYHQVFMIKEHGMLITADDAGAYSANLRPGQYYILVQSNHRKGETVVEFEGQIELKTITIEPKKESTYSAEFNVE